MSPSSCEFSKQTNDAKDAKKKDEKTRDLALVASRFQPAAASNASKTKQAKFGQGVQW